MYQQVIEAVAVFASHGNSGSTENKNPICWSGGLFEYKYNIQWEKCSCLRGIRLEDVTVELEEEAYEEMRNNK